MKQVRITIRAKNLQNVAKSGKFSKGISSPFAVVTTSSDLKRRPHIVGETETMIRCLNPIWIKTFKLDYDPDHPPNLLIKIFDNVKDDENISMGSALFKVESVFKSEKKTSHKKIKDKQGTITINVEEVQSNDKLKLKLSGIKLTNTEGFFRKSDPYYQFSIKVQGLTGLEWKPVYQSDCIRNNLDPKWDEECIDLELLCKGGDRDAILLLSVYDYESNGKHVLMGEFETSIDQLLKHQLFDLKKKEKKTGTIVVHQARIEGELAPPADCTDSKQDTDGNVPIAVAVPVSPTRTPIRVPFKPPEAPVALNKPSIYPSRDATFTDYIDGGCEIDLSVAIDFTSSNGDPRKPGTLHYRDPSRPNGYKNDYETAISTIGNKIAQYSPADMKSSVRGFGAKYGGIVRHYFQCGPSEEVDGIEGILDAYHHTFKSGIMMSKETVLTEVIEATAERATVAEEEAANNGMQRYAVLLILIDGAASNMVETARCINKLGDKPLSIVIVGIGEADFESMQSLGGARFVQFNDYNDNHDSLTHAALKEVPDQVASYFLRKDVMPSPTSVQVDVKNLIDTEDETMKSQPYESDEDLVIQAEDSDEDLMIPSEGNDFDFI